MLKFVEVSSFLDILEGLALLGLPILHVHLMLDVVLSCELLLIVALSVTQD